MPSIQEVYDAALQLCTALIFGPVIAFGTAFLLCQLYLRILLRFG